MFIALFLICLFASIIGAICGIGGGIIIKPVLDLFRVAEISTINFLSGCTVLSMTMYSVLKSLSAGEKRVRLEVGTPLALGAVLGGILGNMLFNSLKTMGSGSNLGAVQAMSLLIITAGALIYTLKKDRIKTYDTHSIVICVLIGLFLGITSSFLGIGGGPINLVVLYYFFSMDSKTAAANSLYIILFSQLASLIMAVVKGTVPSFDWLALIVMVAGGIGGGIIGRKINKAIDDSAVTKLFFALMLVIIVICIYNFLSSMSVL